MSKVKNHKHTHPNITITPLPKQEKKYVPKMKQWPDDPTSLVPYEDLISPLKKVIESGYFLSRKATTSFDYDGFDIGKEDAIHTPSPKVRLTEPALMFEKSKFNRYLIDVVLNIAFMLGMEQGRRSKNLEAYQVDVLMEQLELYKLENQSLRIRNDELETIALASKQEDIPAELETKRRARIAILKSKQSKFYNVKSPIKTKFKEMVSVMKSFDEKTTTLLQYKDILNANGWTQKQYIAASKK